MNPIASGCFYLVVARSKGAWMRSVSWTAVAAVVLVLVGAGGLVYAPENKTVVKVVVLLAGVVLGLGGWLRARISRR